MTSALVARAALSITLLLGTGGAWAASPRVTIVMGKGIDEIVSLDPAEVYEAPGGEVVGNLYDRLIEIDPLAPGRLRPGLALSWQVGADGRTYTFTLRADARFTSGALPSFSTRSSENAASAAVTAAPLVNRASARR